MNSNAAVIAALRQALREAVLEAERSGSTENIDLLGVYSDALLAQFDDVLPDLLAEIVGSRDLSEDPNAILSPVFPRIDRSKPKYTDKIRFADLTKRTPFSTAEIEELAAARVVFLGFGGIQGAALLLARLGVGHLRVIDHDDFEPTNANRQALCYESTLSKPKVDVGAQFLKDVCSELIVDAQCRRVQREDIADAVSDATVVVDGTGDKEIRDEIHRVCRGLGVPVISWAWAGFEGQVISFSPSAPLYYEVLDYSPYTDARGFDAAGLEMLNSCVALDAKNLILGNDDLVVKYPLIRTFSLHRRNVMLVLNVEAIRDRNSNRAK